ncbi:MAG: MurR/RpiR family transcriptional regulator [Oscillospiraceae bacterium]|jgi:DNA-binding MurR/RpiR family transcriptional regulator|nr:MurR/RpiR family transcriptional regulator [Oscillospiraceae bacterium]
MNSVIVRFKEHMASASNTERGIIRYVLENPEEAVQMSIHELARRSFVSASAVTRLCKKTGFQNYKDYQRRLSCELALKKEAISQQAGEFEIRPEDSLEVLVKNSFQQTISSLDDTRSLLDIRTLQNCVDLLVKAESVTFFGVGASLLVAKDAYLKFIRLKKRCQVYEDQDAQLVLAKNMKRGELAVLISYSGRTETVVEIAGILRENAVPMIAITGFAESPLRRWSTYNLYVSAAELAVTGGKLASRISQLAVIDALYIAYFQRTYDKSADALQNTHLTKKGEEEWSD